MRSIGVIVMGVFAAIWWAVGVGMSQHASAALMAAGGIVSLGLAVAAVRADRHGPQRSTDEQRRIGILVGWASAAEGVAILVAVNVLNWLGLHDFFICALAAIVGAHFIPLARLPHARIYYATAAALMLLGAAGCLLPAGLRFLVATGAALSIWVTCGYVAGLVRPRRAQFAI